MTIESTLILDTKQVNQKLTRIAHHIYENHYKEKEIFLVGIAGRGDVIAKMIGNILRDISPINIHCLSIALNKDKPTKTSIELEGGELAAMKNKVVILVDDVLNSGRTLVYAMKFLLEAAPKNVAITTLVDRTHRRFPIHADYAGLTLSTNLKEHVRVELTPGKEAVYLDDREM